MASAAEGVYHTRRLTPFSGDPSLPSVMPDIEPSLSATVEALHAALGDNLYSVCLYGSTVRGNAINAVSDFNLLIVLNDSTVAAHRAIAEVLGKFPRVDPFILAKRGFARSVRAFAPKFASIKRHHRVLHGADPLAEIAPDPAMEKFLCEQSVRNLRLRLVYAFVMRGRQRAYDRFVIGQTTALFVQLSDLLRIEGVAIPTDFAARIPVFTREFAVEAAVLDELLALKREPRRLSEAETVALHGRLFPVVDGALRWIEARWAA